MVVVWNTQNVCKDGEVTILAKAHTDVDISTMKVAFFDDTRYLTFLFMCCCLLNFFLIQQVHLYFCKLLHVDGFFQFIN